ncbi:hypothetical protein TRIUR3_16835 [Triticum urartu]|uniref:Uncharacterized protein n=1 Tax=Triticum urartu TaxID=4572 RepID=M7ZDX8_TRIUA|nr:hypothetical protein TRIUR3_16835 [Triticum urartu]
MARGQDTEPQDRFTTEANNSKHNPNSRKVASGQQDPTGPEDVVKEMPHQCTLRPKGPRSKWRPILAPSTVVGLEQPEQRLQGGNDAIAPSLPEPVSWI